MFDYTLTFPNTMALPLSQTYNYRFYKVPSTSNIFLTQEKLLSGHAFTKDIIQGRLGFK